MSVKSTRKPQFGLLTKGSSNPKTEKGEKLGYMTFILHLAPADESGYEVCRWRTAFCTKVCLNRSGHGAIVKQGETTNAVQEARKRRTVFFFEDRDAFLKQLIHDIEHASAYATARGFIACFRLNGTSDLLWEYFPVVRGGRQFASIFEAFAEIQFYDYTKAPYSARRHLPNYDLTFSYAETLANHLNAEVWLAHGHNLSVVFGLKKSAALPETFQGRRVFNADANDLRFRDEKGGLIAGLHVKGNLWKKTPCDGFVVKA